MTSGPAHESPRRHRDRVCTVGRWLAGVRCARRRIDTCGGTADRRRDRRPDRRIVCPDRSCDATARRGQGFRAENTRGNAVETARWVEFHNYKSLIVVTADYHIPRAILELKSTMPGVELHPYPVVTDTVNARRWWAKPEDSRRMIVEYSKYLTILSREITRSLVKSFHHDAQSQQRSEQTRSEPVT